VARKARKTVTSAELPVRPAPYIAVGNGWTINVKVPGYGMWRRNPLQVSGYAVYNQTGSDYHITIDRSYISQPANPDPSATLNIHITSNTAIGSKTLHWPGPGFLTTAQQDWMDLYNGAGEFDGLIGAFETQIKLCATNVKLSRDYDTAMEEYGRLRFAVAVESRQARESFDEELADWMKAACPPDAFLPGFQKDGVSYFLDLDRGVILSLDPKPLLVESGGGLDPGFANMCGRIIGGKVAPLTAAKWGDIQAGLVLLRLRDKEHAMRRSDFAACLPAKTLLTLDQVVDQAVTAWTEDVASSKAYTVVATDNTLTNVIGPDSARFHLATANLLDGGALIRLGTSKAEETADTLAVYPGFAGVYEIARVAELQAALPKVVRISKGAKPYIVPELLAEGWSTALAKGSTVDATALAADLVAKGAGCQFFAENLVVKEKSQLAVYLLNLDESGPAYYLGPKDEVVPGFKDSGKNPLDLKDGQRVRYYFSNGLSSTAVASAPDEAIVICGANKKSLTPPLFVALKNLNLLDLVKAREAYAAILLKKKAEEAEAARIKVAALAEEARIKAADEEKYANAWRIIEPQLGSGPARLKLYAMREGAPVAVRNDDERGVVGGTLLGAIEVTKKDKSLSQGRRYRYLEFPGGDRYHVWIAGMANYIITSKPNLPTGFKGYLVTRQK
jgi:hypothetical protein